MGAGDYSSERASEQAGFFTGGSATTGEMSQAMVL